MTLLNSLSADISHSLLMDAFDNHRGSLIHYWIMVRIENKTEPILCLSLFNWSSLFFKKL